MWPKRHSTCVPGGVRNEKGKLACPCWGEQEVVQFSGPKDAELVIVGQGPGRNESRQGLPFVGPSGELLDSAISQAGLIRADVLLANALCCQPKTKSISAGSVTLCSNNYLIPAIEEHPRKLIVALGNEAKYAVLGDKKIGGVLRMLGSVVDSRFGCPVVVTCHPALALRRPEYTDVLVDDMKKAAQILRGEYEAPDVAIPPIHPHVTNIEEALSLLESLPDVYAADIETTGLQFDDDPIVGISFAYDKCAFYIPFIEQGVGVWSLSEFVRLYDAMNALFQRGRAIGHNWKFDLKFLAWQYHMRPAETAGDIMLAQQLWNENLPLGLSFMATRWLGAETWKDSIDHKGGGMDAWQRGRPNMWQDPKEMSDYAAKDTAYTWALHPLIEDKLEEIDCTELYHTITLPLLEVLHQAETIGLRPDVAVLDELSSEFRAGQDRLAVDILEHVPQVMRHGFNIDSWVQISWLLFEHLGIAPTLDTDGRDWYEGSKSNPSTSKDAVALMSSHPVTDALVKYRHLCQMDRTFITGFRDRIASDGRVHTSFAWNPRTEGMVKTGRIQASNPNVMNVPKGLRPMIIAAEGKVLLVTDASQMELRAMAVYSQDDYLLDVFSRGLDVHSSTAAEMLGKPIDQITADERKSGKTLNFAIVYGMGIPALAADLGCTMKAAQAFHSRYFSRVVKLKRWLADQVSDAQRQGYVSSLTGRRRRLPAIWHEDEMVRAFAERQAKNSPVQGLGADITHLKAAQLLMPLQALGANIINLVHDELLIELDESKVGAVTSILDEILPEPPFPEWNVPLIWEHEVHAGWAGDSVDMEKVKGF